MRLTLEIHWCRYIQCKRENTKKCYASITWFTAKDKNKKKGVKKRYKKNIKNWSLNVLTENIRIEYIEYSLLKRLPDWSWFHFLYSIPIEYKTKKSTHRD